MSSLASTLTLSLVILWCSCAHVGEHCMNMLKIHPEMYYWGLTSLA